MQVENAYCKNPILKEQSIYDILHVNQVNISKVKFVLIFFNIPAHMPLIIL